jgi:probable rRNA maturation factor
MMRQPETVVARAANGFCISVVLTSDRVVKRLNAQHRGRNKPTNVLTFDPAFPGHLGEIVLAAGVVAREARAAGRRPAHHLAHLVIHGALHLRHFDHDHAGAARRMEQEEARLLGRLHMPNPWKRS